MKLKTSIIVISGCLGIFLFIMLPIFLSTQGKKDDYVASLKGSAFSLKDVNNNIVTENSFEGPLTAIFFGFTNCPDICPTTMFELKKIKSELGKNSKELVVLFVSLDPERDTPELLSKYIPSFHSSFIGLTGSEEDIIKIAQQFKIYRKKVIQDDTYTIDHSSGLYLIDKDGKIRIRYPYGTENRLIIQDIEKLI